MKDVLPEATEQEMVYVPLVMPAAHYKLLVVAAQKKGKTAAFLVSEAIREKIEHVERELEGK